MSSPAPARCTVYFDGACPLCRREIDHYQRQAGAEQVAWVDVSRCDAAALGDGLNRADALARLHVRSADGRLVSGAPAFAAIWAQLPAYAWLARLAARRPVVWAMDLVYTAFLRVRTLWRPQPAPVQASATGETNEANEASEANEVREASDASTLPPAVLRDLRTDHAGEVGAVQIYRGVLAVSRDPAVRAFASRHLRTELRHLRLIRRWVPATARSRLLPLWRVAGFVTGALPALFGPRAVFATIAAVERFVDQRYAAQIAALDAQPELAALRNALEACRQDEVAHRDEATALLATPPGPVLRLWAALVGSGSALAVQASRRW